MLSLVQSEYIKGRRSFGRKSLVLLPLLTVLLALLLMGGRLSQIAAYNWWYMLLLPTVVALVCINLTAPEKGTQFFNLAVLPVSKAKIWLAKIWTGCSYVLAANLLVFGLTTILGIFFGSQYPFWRGILAALVLTLTWIWQIPLGMFLSTKFGSAATLLGVLAVNMICSLQTIAGGSLWFIPFAIPARLMAPLIGMNPNGLPLAFDSPLHDTSVLLPGLLISAALFILLLFITRAWFDCRST